jgi:hypothetical protein
MHMSVTDLHRIAHATMADCPPDAEAVWLDCLHDALTETYQRQAEAHEPSQAIPLARLFFCLVAQWNELRVLALQRGSQLPATEQDARSVAEWRTVLLIEAEMGHAVYAAWHSHAGTPADSRCLSFAVVVDEEPLRTFVLSHFYGHTYLLCRLVGCTLTVMLRPPVW